jgi:hypothetical protein
VSIDSSGKWWRGATFDDIAEYTADGCSADQIRESVCTTCGGKVYSRWCCVMVMSMHP